LKEGNKSPSGRSWGEKKNGKQAIGKTLGGKKILLICLWTKPMKVIPAHRSSSVKVSHSFTHCFGVKAPVLPVVLD
jgi:hypothetical protein